MPIRSLKGFSWAWLFGLLACSGGVDSDALSIRTETLPEVALGLDYVHAIEIEGGQSPYVFSLASGVLPDGLSLGSQTGRITGIAGSPGRHEFVVAVVDGASVRVDRRFELFVVPKRLSIVNERLPIGREGEAYDGLLLARGGVPPYDFALVSGQLPDGLTFSGARFAGVPSVVGTFPMAFRLSDAEGASVEEAFELVIEENAPKILTERLFAARFGEAYLVALTAERGRAPLTWSVTDGALPLGLELSEDGLLSGLAGAAGHFEFVVRAQDSAGAFDEKAFSLEVVPPLEIATRSLPQAIFNRPYLVRFEARGGLPPYSWSLRSGALPGGFELTPEGILRGTASSASEHRLSIRVRDSGGAQRLALYEFKVTDRILYEVEPAVAFPGTCTATTVSYTFVPIEVPDSAQIEDLNVALDMSYSDATGAGRNENVKLKVVLYAPDGRTAVLCGNAAGLRQETGCEGSGGIQAVFDDEAQAPERPLSTFDGMHTSGTWRLAVVVAKPTVGAGGVCDQSGTINRISLSILSDGSDDNYIVVGGFRRNNLVNHPWVRVCCGGLAEQQLQLTAAEYNVGQNGVREGGAGDDELVGTSFRWRFSGPAAVATITEGGLIEAGLRLGEGVLTAEAASGLTVELPLFVLTPDWSHLVRQF